MKLNGTVARVGSYIALLPIAYGIWWFAGHVAQAEDTVETQQELMKTIKVLADGQEKLVAIHLRQATVEQAEAALIEKLCRTGKLSGEECPTLVHTVDPE